MDFIYVRGQRFPPRESSVQQNAVSRAQFALSDPTFAGRIDWHGIIFEDWQSSLSPGDSPEAAMTKLAEAAEVYL